MNEADTCRKLVVPKLQAAGWEIEPHSIAEQRTITDGRIVPAGKGFIRRPPKRVDYLLRYTRDFPLAVIEAKGSYRSASEGLQQAKDYAIMLGLKFAYATNGQEVVEFDFITGLERTRADYPTPDDLWGRYRAATRLSEPQADQLLTPFNHAVGKGERYYQQIAVNRVVEAILTGRRRLLVTMATGTGKTAVAFQICWKLWTSRWNRTGEHRRPRILYLADRNILIDQPKDGLFAEFGDARFKIESGEVVKSREMYFGIYQALAEDERRVGLFRSFPSDFFDLVIEDRQAAETALLFLQLIMRKLRRRPTPAGRPARAAVVVPNGTLFGDGVCARIKEELLKEFNLHTIVRLPNGVFAPYTSIPTNLLFFDRSGPTRSVWYYEHRLPEGRKNYTKTAPLQFEEFAACQAWWTQREENERAWTVPAAELLASNCNLDRKNPRAKEDIAHLPPEQIAASILEKEQRIAEIMGHIQKLLAGGGGS